MAVKRTTITVERDTIMVVRNARAEGIWCSLCGAQVDAIDLPGRGLAELLATNEAREWMASGALHVIHEADGPLRVCLASLLRCFQL